MPELRARLGEYWSLRGGYRTSPEWALPLLYRLDLAYARGRGSPLVPGEHIVTSLWCASAKRLHWTLYEAIRVCSATSRVRMGSCGSVRRGTRATPIAAGGRKAIHRVVGDKLKASGQVARAIARQAETHRLAIKTGRDDC